MQDTGIKDLFDERGANLTTFVPDQSVVMSGLFHEASLQLSEEGTLASAGSAPSGLVSTGRFARPQNLKSFNCDHPFVYVIYDKLTRNILFLGTYMG